MQTLILQTTGAPTSAAEPTPALDFTESLRGNVSGFLEVSQMLTGRVPIRELTLDTYLTGEVRP